MKQREVWDNIAESWEERRRETTPEAIDFLKSLEGKDLKVLDVGCGSGRNFVKIKGKIWGVDFSEKMLELAEKNAKEIGIDVELIKAEAENLPFENNFFDAVLCSSLLHCIKGREKRIKVINEIYRILKQKGRAFISVWGKIGGFKNKPKEGFIIWYADDGEFKRYNYFYDKEELEQEMKESGFKIIKSWEEQGDAGNINVKAEKPKSSL